MEKILMLSIFKKCIMQTWFRSNVSGEVHCLHFSLLSSPIIHFLFYFYFSQNDIIPRTSICILRIAERRFFDFNPFSGSAMDVTSLISPNSACLYLECFKIAVHGWWSSIFCFTYVLVIIALKYSYLCAVISKIGNDGGRSDLQSSSRTRKRWGKWTAAFKSCSIVLQVL